MLQQTQVRTVLPYFERWMKRFPDARALADASIEDVLKLWEGLGYYSRAQNIHRTAGVIVSEYGGEFPRTYDELVKLPGIGPYTAGAIMSFAYNEPCPVLDVNVERVLARVFNLATYIKGRDAQAFMRKKVMELIPEGRSRLFNQGLMELGATVCIPRTPRCMECPVRPYCEAFRLGITDQRPVTGKRKEFTSIETALGILVRDGRIFIQKRPPNGLMAGLWEFPGGKIREGETPEDALVREFHEELELRVTPVEKLAVVRHGYTSFKVTLHAFICRIAHGENRAPVLHAAVESRWVSPEDLDRYAFPAANRKLIKLLREKT